MVHQFAAMGPSLNAVPFNRTLTITKDTQLGTLARDSAIRSMLRDMIRDEIRANSHNSPSNLMDDVIELDMSTNTPTSNKPAIEVIDLIELEATEASESDSDVEVEGAVTFEEFIAPEEVFVASAGDDGCDENHRRFPNKWWWDYFTPSEKADSDEEEEYRDGPEGVVKHVTWDDMLDAFGSDIGSDAERVP